MSVLALSFFLHASPLEATIITSARIGGGPARYRSAQKDLSSSSFSGTLRLGYVFTDFGLLGGVDASTFRVDKNSKAGVSHNIDGNQVGVFLGMLLEPWAFWVGGGRGQIRQYDRAEPDQDEPHRYLLAEQEVGMSLDIYRAAYGKIDGTLLWRRYMPDHKWQDLYAVDAIDAWQFELGLKLLTW